MDRLEKIAIGALLLLLIYFAFMAATSKANSFHDDPSIITLPKQSLINRTDHVDIAHGFLGTNPTGQRSLWCADFMNLVERKAGRTGTGSRLARSYLSYGRKVPVREARRGDIVVLSRGRDGRSGHVGYFIGWKGRDPVLISGNTGRNRKVGIGTFQRGRIMGIIRP